MKAGEIRNWIRQKVGRRQKERVWVKIKKEKKADVRMRLEHKGSRRRAF